MKSQQPRLITPWFLTIIFLVLATGIIISGLLVYAKQSERIKGEVQSYLAVIADSRVGQITQWRKEHIGVAEVLSRNVLFAREVEKYFKTTTGSKDNILRIMKDLQKQYGYVSILLLDRKVDVRLSLSDKSNTIGLHARSLVEEIYRKRIVTFSDFHKADLFPYVHMDMVAPIFTPDRNDSTIIGVVLFRIDPNIILFPLIKSWPTPSHSSENILCVQDGDSIVYLTELRNRNNSKETLRLPISNEQLPASMAVHGIEGTVEGTDHNSVPVLATIRRIPQSPWYMITKVDQEEIYKPVRSQVWIIGIGIFLLLLATGSIMGLLWRHQRARFYRKQYEAQLERQALVKHFEYLIKYANDIILLVDMNGRIVEANDQACVTYGYTREEMHRLNIQDIRTPGLSSEIENQMKQQKERGGLVYETEHRRKDSTTFSVEISSQFIKIDNAKYLQCIIRDITERIRAEKVLNEREERFRKIFEEGPLGMATSGTNFKFIKANAAFCRMIGYEENELSLLTFKDITHPEHLAQDADSINRLFTGEIPLYRTEKRYIRKDKRIVWGAATITVVRDKNKRFLYFLVMIEDITERKQAEEALRESEEQFRSLAEQSPNMIFINSKGRVVFANKRCEDIMEYSKAEFYSPDFNFMNLMVPEYRSAIEKNFQKHKNGENVPPIDYALFTKSGKRIETILATQLINYNKERAILGIITDITERKQAEEALKKSEKLFRTLVEFSPISIAVFSGQNQKIEYVSHRFTELFGYKQVDLPSLSAWWPLAYPMEEYRNQIEAAWHHSIEWSQKDNREPEPIESVITCKDGSTKYIESTFTSTSDHTLIFFSDLTQRRIAEEALRQTHAFNDLLIQTMPFGMNIVDEEGNILFVSKTLKEMLTVDVVDMCCWQVYKDNNQQCQNCPLKRGISFGKPDVIETTGILGGKTFQISHVGMMYEGRKAMLEVFQDITEQKKLQQELMQSQKMLSIGTLAGGIAHDFNNILAIIIGYSSMLHSMKENPTKFSDAVNAIKQAVDRGAALVRQILTFARKTDVAFESMDVSDLIQELISMLQQTFPKIITFNKEIETQLPQINADHTQIHQILLNLCVNARDAMPNGGVITIKADLAKCEHVRERFPAANENFYICITISDTGTGMDEITRGRIFDPFFTTKEKGKGTGLGLSVVYGVVQAHQGFVEVDSAVGNGTSFRLYLPVPKESSAAIESGKSEEKVRGGTETLLVVEDEDLLLDMVQILLETHGYTVLTAKDGLEAVAVYSQHANEIALVISDMGLPKLSGENEFRKLKEINPEVKMILASGYFEPDIRTTLESAGIQGFLQKPYVIEDVLAKIRKVLD